jgi:hypothetical protein
MAAAAVCQAVDCCKKKEQQQQQQQQHLVGVALYLEYLERLLQLAGNVHCPAMQLLLLLLIPGTLAAHTQMRVLLLSVLI